MKKIKKAAKKVAKTMKTKVAKPAKAPARKKYQKPTIRELNKLDKSLADAIRSLPDREILKLLAQSDFMDRVEAAVAKL